MVADELQHYLIAQSLAEQTSALRTIQQRWAKRDQVWAERKSVWLGAHRLVAFNVKRTIRAPCGGSRTLFSEGPRVSFPFFQPSSFGFALWNIAGRIGS